MSPDVVNRIQNFTSANFLSSSTGKILKSDTSVRKKKMKRTEPTCKRSNQMLKKAHANTHKHTTFLIEKWDSWRLHGDTTLLFVFTTVHIPHLIDQKMPLLKHTVHVSCIIQVKTARLYQYSYICSVRMTRETTLCQIKLEGRSFSINTQFIVYSAR